MSHLHTNDAYYLFLCAVQQFDKAGKYKRNKQYKQLREAISHSARDLARAILVAKSSLLDDLADDAKLSAAISSYIESLDSGKNSTQYSETGKVILEALVPAGDIGEQQLIGLYKQYADVLVSARQLIARETNYQPLIRKFGNAIANLFLSVKSSRKAVIAMLGIIVVLAIPYGIYQYREPSHFANLSGEIFWQPDRQTDFNMGYSRRFPVKQGDSKREYMADHGSQQRIYSLRFDPVNDKYLAIIEIDWIRFLDDDRNPLLEIAPERLQHWTCHSCEVLSLADDHFRIQVTGKDPYLVSPVLDQEGVRFTVARMRVLSKKTFWEWVFQINR